MNNLIIDHRTAINTEAYKRVFMPDSDDFSTYVKKEQDDVWVLKNNYGRIIHKFKNQEDCELHAGHMQAALKSLFTYKFNADYLPHMRQHPQYYLQTREEANMTHRFLYDGFTVFHPFNPYENWFGVSTYDPNLIFDRGNKRIVLSLSGMAMPMPNLPGDNEIWVLIKKCKAKYIGFHIDNKPVYETWSGVLPTKEFIEDFTKQEENV